MLARLLAALLFPALLALLLVSAPADHGDLHPSPTAGAFPGAEGFGAAATGGRGGRVIKVTNLDASGPGSLQAALDVNAPRIIAFAVSGVITGNVHVPYGNVTIAGQSAPGAGITIAGRLTGAYTFDLQNVIVRHLRVRTPPMPAGADGDSYDGVQFGRGRTMIFDHLSVSWGVDEVFDVFEANDVTVQWTAIEEAEMGGHPEGADHNMGLIQGPGYPRISLHHNLFAHNRNRNPALSIGPAEVRNNVAYNVRHVFHNHNPTDGKFNIVGNYMKQGPNDMLYPFHFDGAPGPSLSYHLRDNYVDDPGELVGSVDNPWQQPYKHPTFANMNLPSSYYSETEHNFTGVAGHVPVTTEPSAAAYSSVLARVGAFPRDTVTSRIVGEVRARTGAWGSHRPANLLTGLTPTSPPADGDDDGMADAWEQARGLDPSNGTDHAGVMPSGYTAIEEYVNELADALAGGG